MRSESEERNAEAIALRYAERLARTPPANAVKQCRKCGETKPMLSFYAHRSTRDGRANYCMECQKAASRAWTKANAEHVRKRNAAADKTQKRRLHRRWWLRLYNLTEEQYDQMLAAQGGVCAICKNPETALDSRTGEPRRLAVDHCHTSGRVRGLLCMTCNRMLGASKDDPAVLKAAAAYLAEVAPMD